MILVILATVSIYAVLGENGLIRKAQEAKEMYASSVTAEEEALNTVFGELVNAIGETPQQPTPQEPEVPAQTPISTADSYVGYYADKEGDGTVDGIIFADLRIGNTGSATLTDGTYTIPTIGSSKEYYVKEANYAGSFGEHPVIAPVTETTGNDRFYIMALSDVSSNHCYWYYNAKNNGISNYNTVTSTSFGTGKTNTETMLIAWNAGTYGAKVTNSNPVNNSVDMWGEVTEGWFIPSKEEWSAFAGELGINSSNYYSSENNLLNYSWSSSLNDTFNAWLAYFNDGYMYSDLIDGYGIVRLAATF